MEQRRSPATGCSGPEGWKGSRPQCTHNGVHTSHHRPHKALISAVTGADLEAQRCEHLHLANLLAVLTDDISTFSIVTCVLLVWCSTLESLAC